MEKIEIEALRLKMLVVINQFRNTVINDYDCKDFPPQIELDIYNRAHKMFVTNPNIPKNIVDEIEKKWIDVIKLIIPDFGENFIDLPK